MRYLTGYHMCENSEKRECVLLLQQYRGKGRRKNLFFGLAGYARNRGELTEYIGKQLLDWFRYQGLSFCEKQTENNMRKLQTGLEEKLFYLYECIETHQPVEKMGIVGLLCIDREFFWFGFGETKVLMIQALFDRCHVRHLKTSADPWVSNGFFESGGRMLLGVGGLADVLERETFAKNTDLTDLDTEEKLKKWIKEVGIWSEKQECKDGAMIGISCTI